MTKHLIWERKMAFYSENQYLDDALTTFYILFKSKEVIIKSQNVSKQIDKGVKFKPCQFILSLLIEGEKLTGKPFSITAEELTQCAIIQI